MGLGRTHRFDSVVAETLDDHLVRDEEEGAVDLAPEDRVGRNYSVADDAGKVGLLLIVGKEGEVRIVFVYSTEVPHGQY